MKFLLHFKKIKNERNGIKVERKIHIIEATNVGEILFYFRWLVRDAINSEMRSACNMATDHALLSTRTSIIQARVP